MSGVNVPIRSVTPSNAHGEPTGPPVTNLPAPVNSDWVEQDFSAPGAGRLESGRALKQRKGIADRLDIEWQYLTRAEAAFVIQTFRKHEYIIVEYLSAAEGDWISECFYVGDRYARNWLPQIDRWEAVRTSIIRVIPDPG